MTRAWWIVLAGLLASSVALADGDLVNPKKGEIPLCESALKENFAIRYRVTVPAGGGVFKYSCESRGPNSCLYDGPWGVPKAAFVATAGLGSSDNYVIENHDVEIIEQSRGADFSHTHDSDRVFGRVKVEKDWFGGGQTVQFRAVAILRQNISDRTAAVIGRICSAYVFGPGAPR
jgi:hypothetical protein